MKRSADSFTNRIISFAPYCGKACIRQAVSPATAGAEYDVPLAGNGLIVMGNEGNGISPAIERAVTRKLRIPNYPVGAVTCESLNVAVATAITCAEFRRRVMKG